MPEMPITDGLPNPNEKLAELGIEFTVGFDVDRKWVTGAQSFIMGPATVIVFRDQMLLADQNGQFQQAIKNVASVVMPNEVAIEFHRLLGESLKQVEANGGSD